jgi:hypothetical protein
VAASIALVFRALSSGVSPRQPSCLRGPHGVSLCPCVRVLPPQAMGGFSRDSTSQALDAVASVERRLPEGQAQPLYGQTSRGASQAGRASKCGTAVTSRTDRSRRQPCDGSARNMLAMHMALVEGSRP